MRRWLVGVALALAGSPGLGSEAGACPPGAAVLEARLAGLRTLRANFEQQVEAADGHPLQTSTGILQLARPGRIYWVAEPPFEQTVVADGTRIWVYDPDLEQVTVRTLHSQLDNSPAALLVGDPGRVLEEFRVCAFSAGQHTRILLRPLVAEAIYREVELEFAADRPLAIRMTDSLGQRTRIALSEVEINQPLEPGLFQFTPPPGVDVFRDD
ncbi:MAG: outer membrane lipoprotein chaperone LolA [Pseudomonadota bacterium]|jgi:outer membrane lipoprotein carrier protein